MYRPNEPHGVGTTTVPTTRRARIGALTATKLKTGVKKMELMNEAMARVRMYELWRQEHRHRRRAADVIRDVRRRRRQY